jgi:hypothetical protein
VCRGLLLTVPGELRERDATLLVARDSARMSKTSKQVVQNMLSLMEKKMASEGIKGTIADYIRLMQLHKELDDDAPREIKVTWVEPKGNEATNEAEKTESGSGE